MKNKKPSLSALFLIISLTLLSCKDLSEKSAHENQLVVHVELKILKDDFLELYFDDRESKVFSSKRSIRKKIKGDSSFQKVSFMLDDSAYPNRIRIDLGENREQPAMEIKQIALQYNKAIHVFSPQELETYFKSNIYVDFNSFVATPKIMEGKYDPYLESFNLSKFINQLILQ
tara:strand:- start:158 stop:676 length:519 start_codon:yes stop_codon:yes gene_type:complete